MMRRFLHPGSLALTAAALVSVIGCSMNGGGETDDDEDTGMAQIAISQVPSDGSVGCISVTAEGSFTVTESVDVTPGQSTVIDMKHLPVGTVSFTGDAYQGPCAAVTAATEPTWISDPVLASVSHVQPVTVHLVMKKNGKADVDVDFPDDPACSADGAPCFTAAECCSQSCTAGSCGQPSGCGPGLTTCNAACVDLTSDPLNCGACGSQCPIGAACQNGACMAPSCVDAIKNGAETDVDCGGVCPPCAAGYSCVTGADCVTGVCTAGTCAQAQCLSAADCPGAATECQAPTCTGGVCGFVNAPAGTPVSMQIPGDCKQVMCDGAGFFVTIPNDADLVDDGNPCTVDMCSGGTPLQLLAPAGTACGPSSVCDGAGNCI
jgi:hypothetical protein